LTKFLVKCQRVDDLAKNLNQPDLLDLIRIFLRRQLNSESISDVSSSSSLDDLPQFRAREKIVVYKSAVATFFAPSDISGIGGMRRERIRAISNWRNDGSRYDCMFVNTDPTEDGMRGLDVARARLFFSFRHSGVVYPCALVEWYSRIGDAPHDNTGMWMVEPDVKADGTAFSAVIHIDSIFRAAHLIGVYGEDFVPRGIQPCHSLDIFHTYYVNKFIDHQAFEIAY
jgi:hypothetical protein